MQFQAIGVTDKNASGPRTADCGRREPDMQVAVTDVRADCWECAHVFTHRSADFCFFLFLKYPAL